MASSTGRWAMSRSHMLRVTATLDYGPLRHEAGPLRRALGFTGAGRLVEFPELSKVDPAVLTTVLEVMAGRAKVQYMALWERHAFSSPSARNQTPSLMGPNESWTIRNTSSARRCMPPSTSPVCCRIRCRWGKSRGGCFRRPRVPPCGEWPHRSFMSLGIGSTFKLVALIAFHGPASRRSWRRRMQPQPGRPGRASSPRRPARSVRHAPD